MLLVGDNHYTRCTELVTICLFIIWKQSCIRPALLGWRELLTQLLSWHMTYHSLRVASWLWHCLHQHQAQSASGGQFRLWKEGFHSHCYHRRHRRHRHRRHCHLDLRPNRRSQLVTAIKSEVVEARLHAPKSVLAGRHNLCLDDLFVHLRSL